MAKVNEKQFLEIANSERQAKGTAANVDLSVVEAQSSKELSETEKINAFLANHAVEHYCAALGENEAEINSILKESLKESGIYWVYTSPKFDETHKREEWMKSYSGAVSLGLLGGVEWFKRPFVIGDARGVKTVVNSYNRYQNELENAEKRADKKEASGIEIMLARAKEAGLSLEEYLKQKGLI